MSRNQILIGAVVAALIVLGLAAYFILGESGGGSGGSVATAADLKPLPDDHVMGSRKAKITAIEYAAPMCPHCAHFNEEGMPILKRDYIDTGKVLYIFRVFPIGDADIAAESLARCMPADNYFAFIDQLYRNQANWDPENNVQDVQGALVAQARIAGMSGDQALECMRDPLKNAHVKEVQDDAQKRYGINGTPTFVLNGEVQTAGAQWPEVKAALDAMLAKK